MEGSRPQGTATWEVRKLTMIIKILLFQKLIEKCKKSGDKNLLVLNEYCICRLGYMIANFGLNNPKWMPL